MAPPGSRHLVCSLRVRRVSPHPWFLDGAVGFDHPCTGQQVFAAPDLEGDHLARSETGEVETGGLEVAGVT